VSIEIAALIERPAIENHDWGCQHIQGSCSRSATGWAPPRSAASSRSCGSRQRQSGTPARPGGSSRTPRRRRFATDFLHVDCAVTLWRRTACSPSNRVPDMSISSEAPLTRADRGHRPDADPRRTAPAVSPRRVRPALQPTTTAPQPPAPPAPARPPRRRLLSGADQAPGGDVINEYERSAQKTRSSPEAECWNHRTIGARLPPPESLTSSPPRKQPTDVELSLGTGVLPQRAPILVPLRAGGRDQDHVAANLICEIQSDLRY